MAKKSKSGTGKRYTDEQKKAILAFVEKQGRGGLSKATEKWGVSYLTIRSWMKADGKAPKAGKRGRKAKATKVKGKRGRPAKVKAKGKRGRPAGSGKRGRPAGSKNKTQKATRQSPKVAKELHALRQQMTALENRVVKLEEAPKAKAQPKPAPKAETPKAQPKAETKPQSKPETKPQPKADAQSKADAKVPESKVETKAAAPAPVQEPELATA